MEDHIYLVFEENTLSINKKTYPIHVETNLDEQNRHHHHPM